MKISIGAYIVVISAAIAYELGYVNYDYLISFLVTFTTLYVVSISDKLDYLIRKLK
jgi:hypothetical protein